MTTRAKLRSARLRLREKSLVDSWNDYQWRSDEELARLDAAPPLHLPYPEYAQFFAEEIQSPIPGSRRLAIDTLTGKHIGNCMYYDIDFKRKQAEMGIMIGDRGYWDKGYGLEAVTVLLNHIFVTTNLERVYLHTLDWNTRAQRCFEKCGFSTVKTVQRAGKKFLYMEILRPEWEATQSSDAGVDE